MNIFEKLKKLIVGKKDENCPDCGEKVCSCGDQKCEECGEDEKCCCNDGQCDCCKEETSEEVVTEEQTE